MTINMKRIITFLLMGMMCWLNADAAPINRQAAMQKAAAFLKEMKVSQQLSPVVDVQKLAPRRSRALPAADVDPYYVFNRGNGEGFIIVSGDDQTEPVLGYCDKGSFDYSQTPDNMKSWLAEYENQITYLWEHPQAIAKAVEKHPKVPQLMTCTWNQGDPYNQNCPNYFGQGRSVTGCVATAMAQIMYYQRDKSTDRTLAAIPAYVAPTKHAVYGQLHVDGIPEGAPIDWANMRDSYNSSATAVQREAVANLMLYCGVSVQMDYTNSASGAYSYRVAEALRAYFGYGASVQYIQQGNYTNEKWDEVCYNELANGRAFYLSGANSEAGHAFVCDGYDGNFHYHINWGWGGQSDGYYLLSNLSPGQQGIGGSSNGYNSGVEAIIGMEPDNFQDMPINFSDTRVRTLCVENWDTNGDGRISYGEAAAIEDLGTVFKGQTVKSLKELRHFTNLKTIADDAFNGCISLTTITLPKTVTSIGARAFSGCRALTTLLLPDGVTAIGDEAFNGCKALTALTIPEGVTAIGAGTFENCAAITEMNLPAGISAIGSRAFAGCAKLVKFRANTATPATFTMGSDVFADCKLDAATLTVEEGGKALFAQADQWNAFGTIKEYRSMPKMQFSKLVTDRKVYLYNVGMKRFLNKGEAWGTQAIVDDEPMLFVLKQDKSMPSGTYYLYSDDTGKTGKVLFRTNSDNTVGNGVKACFVDGFLGETAYWTVEAVGDYYRFQPPTSSADYANGRYLGVLTSHASKYAKPTYGAYYDISYTGNEENCQWAIVDYEAVYGTYNAATRLQELINLANTRNLDTSMEQDVLDNMQSTLDDLKKAQRMLRRKLGFINFADDQVYDACVANWDIDVNNEISRAEASMITDLGYVFYGSNINSFDELQYFTNLSTIGYYALAECPNLKSVVLPESVTKIYSYAFSSDVSLTEIELPHFVSSIGTQAFAGCTSLKSFTVGNANPEAIALGENVFRGVDLKSVTLFVPQGSKDAYAAAPVWGEFGTIKEVRALGEPASWSIDEGQMVYVYNLGTGKYLTAGEAYGTQAVVGTKPTLYALYRPDNTPEGVYYLQAFETGRTNNTLFRTDTDSQVGEGVKACFVDGTLSSKAYWKVNLIDNGTDNFVYTLQVPSNDPSYQEGRYLGTQSNHASQYAQPTDGVYYDVEYEGNEKNCQWGFVFRLVLEDAQDDLAQAKELKKLLDAAHEQGIEATAEQAVYDNLESTREEIAAAITSLRSKLHYIDFVHDVTKTTCVNNWDDNDDGELSLEEAAAVKTIGTIFRRCMMNSFDELQYFTSLTSIPDNAFQNCTALTSLYIPDNIKEIGANAFNSCSNLKYVALPKATSPIVASASALQRSATVFVPKDALETYQADEYWSRFSYEEFTGKPVVRGEDQVRQYGRNNATFKYKVEGAPVNGKPEFAIYHTVDATAPVGTYDVEIFSGTITTPNVEYIAPKLIVEPAPVTITAKSYTRKYGEPNPEFELTYRSFRNREKAEDVLTKQPVIECDATETSPAGDYEIRVSGAEAQNYVFEYVAGVLTIEGDPSGVDLQRARTADGSTFDLQGRKMKNAESSTSQLPKGVYIRNGKKVVIR